MDADKARVQLLAARAAVAAALEALGDTATQTGTVVKAGSNLQQAITAAAPGAVLQLENGTYEGALSITKPVTLTRYGPLPEGRAIRDASVVVTSAANSTITIRPEARQVRLIGVNTENVNAEGQLVDIQKGAQDVRLDRCAGWGHPANGLHRGILAHGQDISLTRGYLDDIFQFGRDSVCIGAWDGGHNVTVDDYYMRGGAETIMLGGADSASDADIPSEWVITHSTLTKNPAGFAKGWQYKNAFELKSARHVRMADCIVEYAGTAQGQGGYLFVFTVRNQNGKAPWSTIEDVTVERVLGQHCGACVQFLGRDNHPGGSGTLDGVRFSHVKFTDINPAGITGGTGRAMSFEAGPRNVTLEHITLESPVTLNSYGAFAAAGKTPKNEPTGLVLRDWNVSKAKSTYGWKIDAGGQGVAALKAYLPDLVYEITPTDVGAQGVPVP